MLQCFSGEKFDLIISPLPVDTTGRRRMATAGLPAALESPFNVAEG
jgi:hypothetical protein